MGKEFDHKRINDILYMWICFGVYCLDLVGTGSLHYILSQYYIIRRILMTPQPNWKEKFVEETMKRFEDDGRIIAQLPSERLADECGSRLAQLVIGVRIALRETIILAERHAQEKVYADLRAIADGENTRN
jgi:hypothetical protein